MFREGPVRYFERQEREGLTNFRRCSGSFLRSFFAFFCTMFRIELKHFSGGALFCRRAALTLGVDFSPKAQGLEVPGMISCCVFACFGRRNPKGDGNKFVIHCIVVNLVAPCG